MLSYTSFTLTYERSFAEPKLHQVETQVVLTFVIVDQRETTISYIYNIYSFTVRSFKILEHTNNPKYSKVILIKSPVILTCCSRSNWNFKLAHSKYIYPHCMKIRILWQGLHTKVLRTKCYTNIPKPSKFRPK